MKDRARLIIPVWGELYVSKVLTITLPAVLAPGNLPALRGLFEVELVIVTESRLFGMIRGSRTFEAAAKICDIRLVPLDDLLTDVFTDYGMVLTYALFRGFTDLGPSMTATYLLFLNADFVVSDGSLRHLGNLMREGKRVIHAPSFRVTSEHVWPKLKDLVDTASCALTLAPRQMAKLALMNKHPTVKARTVNQRLCHLSWMDQYYWYVDEDTLIGYQSPAALVAIKPERVVTEPLVFWDYGFIPEAAPTADPYFIDDSDDYFMIEPQSRDTGQEMVQPGWLSLDDLARSESLRSTKEHRESGKQLLKIHAADLPADLEQSIKESRAYMAEIYRRLSESPAPHVGHPLLSQWFEEAKARRDPRAQSDVLAKQDAAPKTAAKATPSIPPLATRALQALYRGLFGTPPQIGPFHPFWLETFPIGQRMASWRTSGKENILSVDRSAPLRRRSPGGLHPSGPYDACICRLTFRELSSLDRLYGEIRPLMKNGAHVVFNVIRSDEMFGETEFFLSRCDFPDLDVSEIHFYGTAITSALGALCTRGLRSTPTRPIARAAIVTALILLAPVVRLANAHAARRDSSVFSRSWTSLVIDFTVKRRGPPQAETGPQSTDVRHWAGITN